MKILVPTTNIKLGDTIELKAGARYVASDNVAGMLAANSAVVRLVADAASFTRPWRGEHLGGKTILIYRALGIGDEFIAARLCDLARRRADALRVLFACFEAHHAFWAHAQKPFELLPSVVPWDVWSAADFHVAGERWWEQVATSDQPDCFGLMAAYCGIRIAPEDAKPFIPQPPESVIEATAKTVAGRLDDRPMVLWGVAASSRVRSYPPEQTRKAIELVLKATNAAVILIGHPTQIAEYEFPESDRVSIYSAGIPGLIALTAVAARNKGCVLTPDSALGHIAAAWPNLPVVSLWSSFDPDKRVANYPNHRPLYNRIRCSPCWAHEQSGDPRLYKGCPLTACNDYCAGLRSIPPSQVADAIIKAITP
jgi:hypothetical protein